MSSNTHILCTVEPSYKGHTWVLKIGLYGGFLIQNTLKYATASTTGLKELSFIERFPCAVCLFRTGSMVLFTHT